MNLFPTEQQEVKQIIYGVCPSKSNCYRIGYPKRKDGVMDNTRPFLFKSEALIKFENSFFLQCNHYRNAAIQGMFEIYMDVFYPNNLADLDNSLKVVLDCLQKKCNAIKNDNKCIKIVVQKFVDKEKPRIEFVIKKI